MPRIGELTPNFIVNSNANPQFSFGSLGGAWMVLFFFGSLTPEPVAAAHAVAQRARPMFDDQDAYFFGVSIDPADRDVRGLKDDRPGIRYFWDFDVAVSRAYGVAGDGVYVATAFLLDRQNRLVATEPASRIEALLDRLRLELALERQSAEDPFAPVLALPRIFEPELCRHLIDHYVADGGRESGFMRAVQGRTVGRLDSNFKRRRDADIPESPLRDATRSRISTRLIPAVEKFLGWRATRIERYIVACYSGEDQGFFRKHRDNTTPGTAHRKFAVSINLNAEEFEGGELRFPEFGMRTYKPPTGGAVVFCCSLLHEATPVTKGVRYAFLPFLYDEAGRQVREANRHTIEDSVPEAREPAA